MTGMGVTELLEKLPALIPALTSAQEEPLSGVVLKLNVNFWRKGCLYKSFSGSLHVRKYVNIQRSKSLFHKEKIKKCAYFIMEIPFKLLPFLAVSFVKCGAE